MGFFFCFQDFNKKKVKMKLKLLRLRARSLGLDPSGTREEIEARIIENSRNSVPKIPQNNFQPHYSLSDEISDNFTTEEEPNLLPNMMMNMEIREKNEEKTRVSAFERIKNRNEKTGISKRNKKKKYLTMPTIETLREMGVNLDNHEEFNIEKMENRAEEFNDMPTLRKRVKRFDEEVAPPFVNISIAKLKNLRLKRFEKKTIWRIKT